jgi:hypothetical protein
VAPEAGWRCFAEQFGLLETQTGPEAAQHAVHFVKKNIKVASKKSFWIKNAWIWPILDLKAPAANKIA